MKRQNPTPLPRTKLSSPFVSIKTQYLEASSYVRLPKNAGSAIGGGARKAAGTQR
jgi:hypothetical protein